MFHFSFRDSKYRESVNLFGRFTDGENAKCGIPRMVEKTRKFISGENPGCFRWCCTTSYGTHLHHEREKKLHVIPVQILNFTYILFDRQNITLNAWNVTTKSVDGPKLFFARYREVAAEEGGGRGCRERDANSISSLSLGKSREFIEASIPRCIESSRGNGIRDRINLRPREMIDRALPPPLFRAPSRLKTARSAQLELELSPGVMGFIGRKEFRFENGIARTKRNPRRIPSTTWSRVDRKRELKTFCHRRRRRRTCVNHGGSERAKKKKLRKFTQKCKYTCVYKFHGERNV